VKLEISSSPAPPVSVQGGDKPGQCSAGILLSAAE
jgi:hypothetical protein